MSDGERISRGFDPKDYWEKRLNEKYGLHGVGYLGLGMQYNRWAYRVKHRAFLRALRSLGLEYNTLDALDIGSGTGFYIERWKKLGVRSVAGSDLTTIAIKQLRKIYPHETFFQFDIGASALDPSLQDRKFDIISAFDVLYHIVDDNRYRVALENVYGLLREHGFFIISEFFLHGKTERGKHEVSRSLKDIEWLLNSAGFRIVCRMPMFVLMNFPVDSDSNIRKLLWKIAVLPAMKSEVIGFILGAMLFPTELMLTSLLKESSTTEIMICKRN